MILGLTAALAWGAGDFGGGLASRRAPLYGVILISQVTGMLLSFGIGAALSEPLPTGGDLVVCAVAGVLGAAGVTMLYHALAVGRMGIVAPVTGVFAAVIPVVAGFVTEGIPGPIVVAGIVVAIVAVVLVSRVADVSGGRSGLPEALIAGTAIGLFGVAINELSAGNVFSATGVIRLVQGVLVLAALIVTGSTWRTSPRLIPALMLVGVLDAAGNACYLVAVQTGQLAIASVLSAMYPVSTVVLAVLFLREPITRVHTLGIVLAGVAIAMIAAG